jgi:hypothetical protein
MFVLPRLLGWGWVAMSHAPPLCGSERPALGLRLALLMSQPPHLAGNPGYAVAHMHNIKCTHAAAVIFGPSALDTLIRTNRTCRISVSQGSGNGCCGRKTSVLFVFSLMDGGDGCDGGPRMRWIWGSASVRFLRPRAGFALWERLAAGARMQSPSGESHLPGNTGLNKSHGYLLID